MPFPADFTAQQQYRMKQMDQELQSAARDFMRSLSRLTDARANFIASNLTALWPATDPEYVHRDAEASTRIEQSDLSTAILHAMATLLNQGTSSATPAQVSATWNRYLAMVR